MFMTEQTTRENDALRKETEMKNKTILLQQSFIIIALSFLALLIAFLYLIIRNRRKIREKNLQLEKLNAEKDIKTKEIGSINKNLVDLSKFKDSMTSFLVHDLKNALNAVVNFDPRSDPDQQISMVKRSGIRMLHLVHNLLDIRKFESDRMQLKIQDISLNTIFKNALNQLTFQAGLRNVQLISDDSSDLAVKADPDIIERVLVNLTDNAIKHSHPGSVIFLSKEESEGLVSVTVKDQGEGISPEFLPFIFDKYTRAGEDKPGNRSFGLGLAFCKMAIEASWREYRGHLATPGRNNHPVYPPSF
jgi:signal transduction histidine kinase